MSKFLKIFMPVTVKSSSEIKILKEGGRRLAAIRDELARRVVAGTSAQDIEDAARKLFCASGGEPSFLNYRGRKQEKPFPACVCVSVNDAIVHGLPRPDIVFKDGDVVGVDVGLKFNGLYTDTAVTVIVKDSRFPPEHYRRAGRTPACAETASAGRQDSRIEKGKEDEKERLVRVTKDALAVGIAAARAGATTGDIGFAVEQFVKSRGAYGIVRTLCGHGVGYAVHEEPQVPNFGKNGEGVALKAGMVLAIEPMLTLGGEKLVLDSDGFSFRTSDGSLSAHFEHTIAVTEKGAEVLTQELGQVTE